MSVCYLNGSFEPLETARVSVLDRGFLFADGVYEVLPAYAGRLFGLEEHLERLRESLAAIELQDPLGAERWGAVLRELVERNGGGDLSLYLEVTRGPAYPRDHFFPAQPQPTVFAMASPLTRKEPAPVGAVTLQDIRWQHCDIKSVALLANVLLRQRAARAGAYEALLLREGRLTEGAASNAFLVTDGRVRTPPRSRHILGGITREFLIQALAGTALEVEESEIPERDLREAEEIWLTSSTREILPVVSLDGRPVGDGRPGERWREALERYRALREARLAAPAGAPR